VAVGLMVVFVIINLIGVRWLANFNTGSPRGKWRSRIDGDRFCLFHFHAHNFTAGAASSSGHDGGVHAILEAIAAGASCLPCLALNRPSSSEGK